MTVASHGFGDKMAAILQAAPAFDLPPGLVEGCIDSSHEGARIAESQFRFAFEHSLGGLPLRDRDGGLNGVTGHIAESVTETILVGAGWQPVEHFTGPFSGGHGIDLAMLSPDLERLIVVEVKGTLQARRWPRLARGEIEQMSLPWLGKSDNPGMSSMGVDGNDVSALVILIHFARRQWKGAITTDFVTVHPVQEVEQLERASWPG